MRPADTENFGPVGTNCSPPKSTPQDEIRRLRSDLQEYMHVQEVLVAAGWVTKDTIDKAHEIVRKLG